jgi:hypothetical protein
MVEAYHQFRQTAPEGNPLMIAPSFPQGVASVVAFQVNGSAPLLNEAVDGRDGERPPLT